MIQTLQKEKDLVDKKIRTLFEEAGDLPMYHMLRYFMGYSNDLKTPSEGKHGKRTRSALLLLTANMYGGATSALDLAAAIELFHNFTLVHDDIVDNDEMRRGQETVWKLWGVPHAINSGDAQLLLTSRALLNAAYTDSVHGTKAAQTLNNHFLEVCEGQYLDFELTDKQVGDTSVTEERYFEMIRKKTAVLVGAATEAGGVAAECPEEDVSVLYEYGEALGMAYQVKDDLVSVWSNTEETGKRAYGDVYERKKTYPVLYTLEHGNREQLISLYTKKEELSDSEVGEVVQLFEEAGAKDATQRKLEEYVEQAKKCVTKLSIHDEDKEVLSSIVRKVVDTAGTLAKTAV